MLLVGTSTLMGLGLLAPDFALGSANVQSALTQTDNNLVLAQARTGYPQRQDALINDYGAVLLPADAARLRSLLEQARTTAGIEIVVVTVPSIKVYETGDVAIESFATHLFNTWGIGDTQRNDGVLVLFSAGDRAVRIELGKGYSRTYDAHMQAVINDHMLPHFRASAYSTGLYEGTQALIGQLTGPPPTVLEQLPWGWLIIAGIGLFVYVAFPSLRHSDRSSSSSDHSFFSSDSSSSSSFDSGSSSGDGSSSGGGASGNW